ncbi:MAG: PHP domain-containing protein [Dehalococcoidia bacterium]|nr:MAG: PHP domain-containing protein [Dehalococcoidia bacterium]
MHVHTKPTSSDSMLDPSELVQIARQIGLSGVNMTEHDNVHESHHQAGFRAQHPDFFVNFGMEVSTDMGHMLAVGLRTYLPGIRRAAKLREELDRVGGFLIVAHPFRRLFDPVTAMRTGVKFEMTPAEAAERMPVFKLVHAVEVANGANTPQENEFALEVVRLLGISGTGGSDAHSTSGIGTFATGFEKPITTPEEFLEELHEGRFEAVHKKKDGRWVRFEQGSIDAVSGRAE